MPACFNRRRGHRLVLLRWCGNTDPIDLVADQHFVVIAKGLADTVLPRRLFQPRGVRVAERGNLSPPDASQGFDLQLAPSGADDANPLRLQPTASIIRSARPAPDRPRRRSKRAR